MGKPRKEKTQNQILALNWFWNYISRCKRFECEKEEKRRAGEDWKYTKQRGREIKSRQLLSLGLSHARSVAFIAQVFSEDKGLNMIVINSWLFRANRKRSPLCTNCVLCSLSKHIYSTQELSLKSHPSAAVKCTFLDRLCIFCLFLFWLLVWCFFVFFFLILIF